MSWDILNDFDVRDALQALIDHYGAENVGCAIAGYLTETPVEPIEKEDGDSEGICPICGSRLEYGDKEQMDDGGVIDWECPRCGATGREGYNEVFDGHHYNVCTSDGEPWKRGKRK